MSEELADELRAHIEDVDRHKKFLVSIIERVEALPSPHHEALAIVREQLSHAVRLLDAMGDPFEGPSGAIVRCVRLAYAAVTP